MCIVLFDDKMSAEGAVSGLHHSMMGTRPVNCVIPEPATIRMLVEAGSLPAGNYGYGHMMGRKQPPPGRAPQPMAMPAPMMAAPGAPPMVRPPGMGPGMPGLPMGPMPGMAPAPPPGRPMAGKGGGGGRGQGPVCFHCKQPGHRANECPHRGMGPGMGGPGMGGPGMGGPGMGGPGMMPMGGPGMGGPMGAPHMGGGGMRPMGPGGAVCFICGQPGHRQNECPQAGRGYGGRGY